jgi:hypothetical protein
MLLHAANLGPRQAPVAHYPPPLLIMPDLTNTALGPCLLMQQAARDQGLNPLPPKTQPWSLGVGGPGILGVGGPAALGLGGLGPPAPSVQGPKTPEMGGEISAAGPLALPFLPPLLPLATEQPLGYPHCPQQLLSHEFGRYSHELLTSPASPGAPGAPGQDPGHSHGAQLASDDVAFLQELKMGILQKSAEQLQ